MNSDAPPQNQTYPDVVGIGAVVVDEQLFVDRIPSEDEKEKATAIRQQIGGPVPTALATVRRFDRSCRFIGPWGDDPFGTLIEEDLRREGIDHSANCRIASASTGRAHVWTSNTNGSRTIVSIHCPWEGLVLSAEDTAALEHCRVLHLDGTGGEVAVAAARLVRESGGCVVMDTGSPKEATSDLLPLCDVVSFPERFVQQYFEHRKTHVALNEIRELGPSTAICTRGSNGTVVATAKSITELPAFSVETIDREVAVQISG